MDLDELFGDGAELGNGVVAKAQLRFRVRAPRHPAARDVVDRLVAAYDERLEMIASEVEDVLRHADLRRSHRPLLVIGIQQPDLVKAPATVYAPGARGGKWYRDAHGNVRYGDAPSPKFKTQVPSGTQAAEHLSHLRPSPFHGMHGIDRDLTGFLMDHGKEYGFSGSQLRFLGSWYGTDDKAGSLFDAFLDCAGLTRADLNSDVTQLRFGSQSLTYEEAVFEFFAAQRPLFMGDESENDDADAEWDEILNGEIRPMLDEVFRKYEALKEDEGFKESFFEEADRICNRFTSAARRHAAAISGIADHVISATDPSAQVTDVIAGMQKLGLFLKPGRASLQVHVHDHPHLSDAMLLDSKLLSDDPKRNPLIGDTTKLTALSPSALMLLYAASELYRRWDPDSRSYSDEKQADVGPGTLAETTLHALSEKSEQWAGATPLVRKHLDVLVDRLVEVLNQEESDEAGDGDG